LSEREADPVAALLKAGSWSFAIDPTRADTITAVEGDAIKAGEHVENREAASLDRLLDALAPSILRVVCAPRGLQAEIGSVVLHDRQRELKAEVGDLILGIGIEAGAREATEFIHAAARLSPGAVILGVDVGADEPLKGAAAEAGCTLLAAPAEIDWWRLCSLIRSATEGTRNGRALGDVQAGDLFALADVIASLTGGPTTIEGRDGGVLAFANGDNPVDDSRRDTILNRRVPQHELDAMEAEGVYRRLRESAEPMTVIVPGSPTPRLAIAIRAAGQVLGAIWVAEGQAPLGADAAAALREAADVAALHLIRYEASEDLARRRRTSLVQGALAGKATISPQTLGLSETGPYRVLAVRLTESPEADTPTQFERMINIAELYARSYRVRATAAAVENLLYVITDAEPAERVEHLAQTVAGLRSAAGANPVVGISGALADFAQLPARALDAADAAGVGARLERTITHADEVRGAILMHRLRLHLADAPWLRDDGLERLVDYDQAHDGELLESLRAHLDWSGNIAQAARAVAVHPNTLRYRISRIEEISGLDLENPTDRLLATLCLAVNHPPE
jgi:hypothetical protein